MGCKVRVADLDLKDRVKAVCIDWVQARCVLFSEEYPSGKKTTNVQILKV
jgi:hypothetical protein